jgi:hypothetical protein
VSFVGRGGSNKSSKVGRMKIGGEGKQPRIGVRALPPNLPKNVARMMIAMRYSGKTQYEVDLWLEKTIQKIEQAEKENNEH